VKRPRFLLLLVFVLAGACGRAPATSSSSQSPAVSPPPAAAPIPAPTAAALLTAEDSRKLVGRWHRTDGDYTLEIRGVRPDGLVEARYYNPGPIQVSRAAAGRHEDEIALVVELRDRNYPGNLYTLTYDPAKDELRGLYSHLGLQQTFDVTFVRERAS
jgi:hypothetical protein